MTDDDFLSAFEDSGLSVAQLDHRAHLRAAWLILNRYPLEEAIERICAGIEKLATRFGALDKFNRTLSEALIRLMALRGATNSSQTFDGYLQANRWLVEDVRNGLAAYYSPALLYSDAAKRRFVPPDLQPLS